MLEIEVLNDEKNELEFLIKGERHTLPNLLREALLKDSNVEFVAYTLRHPMDEDSKFVIKTKDKSPKKVLTEALKQIEGQLDEFKKEIKSLK